jgi:hypothetical protein
MKRATIPTVLLVFLVFAQAASAVESFRRFRKGDWETRLGSSYFYSDSNYKGSSTTEPLPGSNTFQLVDMNLSSRYVLSPFWALNAGVNVGYAESKATDATRRNSSLTGALVGVEYAMDLGPLQAIPEFSFLLPFEKNSLNQDAVMTSEGVNETRMRLTLQAVFDSFNFIGSGGYTIRGEGRSSLFPWSVGLEFPFRRMTIGGRLFGYESVSKDADSGGSAEAARLATSLRVNAGSQRFYAVNPALVDTEAYIRYQFSSSLSLTVAGGMTLSGSRAAAGFHGEGILAYQFSTLPVVRRSTPADSNRLTIDPNVDQFREDTNDGIDQQIFTPPKPKPKPKPRQRHTTDPPQATQEEVDEEDQKRIQQQLDDAEYTIQLKSDRKRKKSR